MILADFIVPNPSGLYCVYGDFYLDPKVPVKNAVISHAHGDHAISGNQNVYCTQPTSLFMLHRYKKFAAAEFHLKNYGDQFTLNDVRITFISAGHMAGSAQVVMEHLGVRYIYSGDYKLQADPTSEPITFLEADVFITETTFADPNTTHPDPETEILNLNTISSNIMLGAYALGKSQRIVRLISDYCPEKRILVHHSIMPFMKIYEQLGIYIGKYEVYDRKVMKNNNGGLIYIVPPMVYRSYIKAINVVRVFASGWKHLNSSQELSLCISDHVDWTDIITTIDHVKPKEVWTNHGSGTELKAHFNEKLVVKLLN